MASIVNELPFRPEKPSRQLLRFDTDVMKSYDGSENRHAKLLRPRMRIDYTYLLDAEEERQMLAMLRNDTATTFKVPLWWDTTTTTGAATSGGATVTVTDVFDLQAGESIFIQPKDGSRGEFQVLLTVSAPTLTIVGTWGSTFPADARVMPARLAFAPDGQGVNVSVGLGQMSIALESSEFYLLGGAGATVNTHRSLTLLEREPLRRGAVAEAALRGLNRIDYGAIMEVVTGRARADMSRPAVFLMKGHAEIQYWKKFLGTIIGMREPFYATTGRPDLVPTVTLTGGETVVKVPNTPDPTRWTSSGASHDDLEFDTDGGLEQREISSVADNFDGTSDITFTPALPAGPLVVNKISWLEKVRLASDDISFSHFGHVSAVTISTRTVQA